MSIPIRFIPEIPESKLNASVITKLNTVSSGGSPNVFVPTSKADLENVANAGKTADIQTTIDLGGLDVTLADGLTLYSSGGKLTNYGTITCSNTNFLADRIDRCIIDDIGIITGTFNVKEIWGKWFGLVDTSESALYDNFNAFKNIFLIGKDKNININKGHFYINVKELNLYGAGYTRANLTLTGETHLKGQGKTQTKIEALPNDALTKSAMLVIRDAPNGSISNVWLKGDMDTAVDIENEFRMALNIENSSHGFRFENCRLSHASDGIESKYWNDFGQPSAVFVQGTLDASGNEIASTTEWRSQLVTINSGITQGYALFNLSGYSGYSTLSDFSFKMAFFDVDNIYIGTTSWVYTYKPVDIPTNATQYRAIIPNPIDGVSPTGFGFSGGAGSRRVIITNCEIDHNRRNGLSNPYQEWVIEKNHFHDNGGRIGGPGYAIDIEDGYQLLNDITIRENIFENNFAGAITLRWCKDVRILNNTFLGNKTLIGAKSNINGRETWDCLIENNKMYSTDVSIGRYGKIRNNIMETSNITLANAYTEASNNVIYNGKITRAGDASTAYGTSISRNNQFIITRPKTDETFGTDIKSENDIVIYRNSLTTGDGDFLLAAINGTLIKDYIKNLKVVDAIAENAYIGLNLNAIDLENCEFSAFAYVRGGRNDDFTWKDCKFVDKIVLKNDTAVFSTDGSNFKEWIINGGEIISGTSIYIGTGAAYSVLNTPAVDINLTVKNFTFDLTDATTCYILNLLHNGTALFENCTFKTDAASTFDMKRLSFGSPVINCDTMTFKDCQWINVTPTYRVGDVVIETTKITTTM